MVAPTVRADSPSQNTAAIESALKRADLWLSRGYVSGFNDDDFAFLSANDRKKLADHVKTFKEVAAKVSPTGPATQQQYQKGRAAFEGILEILRFDKYSDPEALSIGKRLEQQLAGRIPAWVRNIRFETGVDANSDAALWIWVTLEDSAVKKEQFSTNVKFVRRLLESALRELSIDRWPYIRFSTVSEQEPPQKKGKR